MTNCSIFIVFDGISPTRGLKPGLEMAGFEVMAAARQQETFREIVNRSPQLVIIDCNKASIKALSLCRSLRTDRKMSSTLVVFLTASADESEQLVTFKLGADDYIAKSSNVMVVVQRIHALLRRPGNPDMLPDRLDVHSVTVRRSRNIVEINGRERRLTRAECILLELLASNPGQPFDRQAIREYFEGMEWPMSQRTIDVHIHNLRAKFKDFKLIQTCYGVGYSIRSMPNSTRSIEVAQGS